MNLPNYHMQRNKLIIIPWLKYISFLSMRLKYPKHDQAIMTLYVATHY